MKRVLRTTILVIILFEGITALTAKIEQPFDGNDVYGFPLAFYTEYSLETREYIPPDFKAVLFGRM
jgi:hypothetical protein